MQYVKLDYFKLNFSFIKEASLVVIVKGEEMQMLKYFVPRKVLKVISFKNANHFRMNVFQVAIKIVY